MYVSYCSHLFNKTFNIEKKLYVKKLIKYLCTWYVQTYPNFGNYTLFVPDILILEYELLCKKCSTHQKLQNKLLLMCVQQKWIFMYSGFDRRSRHFGYSIITHFAQGWELHTHLDILRGTLKIRKPQRKNFIP